MIHQPKAIFNPKNPTPTEYLPDMDALRAAWRSLATEEASASPGCRLGIARKRMELLAGYPERDIPKLIDELNKPKETFA